MYSTLNSINTLSKHKTNHWYFALMAILSDHRRDVTLCVSMGVGDDMEIRERLHRKQLIGRSEYP